MKVLKHTRTRHQIAQKNTHTQRYMNNAWSEMVTSSLFSFSLLYFFFSLVHKTLYAFEGMGPLSKLDSHAKFDGTVYARTPYMWCQLPLLTNHVGFSKPYSFLYLNNHKFYDDEQPNALTSTRGAFLHKLYQWSIIYREPLVKQGKVVRGP